MLSAYLRNNKRLALMKPIILALCCLPFASIGISQARPYTPIEEIIDTTHDFLEQYTQDYLNNSAITGRHVVNVGRLDSRLRMAACDQPLTVSLENTDTPIGRITARVRCEGSAPWSIFVSAQINLYREVVVSTRPLSRNLIVDSTDVMLAERDVSQLRQGYLTQLDEAVGSLVVRPLQADQALTPNQVRPPMAVKRGDRVVISASNSSVQVRMSGEALADGSVGQQVRIRNLSSQRIIYGRVIAPGQVEVDL